MTWWLFQAGFRSQVIECVLKLQKIEKLFLDSRNWTAEDANKHMLVVKREMAAYEPTPQSVLLASREEVAAGLRETDRHGFLVLPIGHLLVNLWSRMRESQGANGGTLQAQ